MPMCRLDARVTPACAMPVVGFGRPFMPHTPITSVMNIPTNVAMNFLSQRMVVPVMTVKAFRMVVAMKVAVAGEAHIAAVEAAPSPCHGVRPRQGNADQTRGGERDNLSRRHRR